MKQGVLEMETKMGWQKDGIRHRYVASDCREDIGNKKYMRERSQQKPAHAKPPCHEVTPSFPFLFQL